MKVITSRENPLYRNALKLGQSSRERRKTRRTILDGSHLVAACLEAGLVPEMTLVSADAQEAPEVAGLLSRLPSSQVAVVATALFREVSPVTTPSGILAIIATPPSPPLPPLPEPSLFLEEIQDPGNLGTLLRSAAAAGVVQIFLSPGCAFAWSPRVLRAAMGAHFQLAVHEGQDLAALAPRWAGRLVAAAGDGDLPYWAVDLTGPVAIAIGNEGAGLSPGLSAQASTRVRIPLVPGVESLNAAVAGSILLFERVRQAVRP